MIPVLAAGIIFGAGTVIGVKYAESILIPAITAFAEDVRETLVEIRKDWDDTQSKE